MSRKTINKRIIKLYATPEISTGCSHQPFSEKRKGLKLVEALFKMVPVEEVAGANLLLLLLRLLVKEVGRYISPNL